MMVFGVLAGARIPNQALHISISGIPTSATVGVSGAALERCLLVTMRSFNLPRAHVRNRGRQRGKAYRHIAAHHVYELRPAPFVRHVYELDARPPTSTFRRRGG
jgi:hypothetical protein